MNAGPSPAPLLEVRGLSVRLGARAVVEGLDLDLAAGEVLAVLGPNGAGKTSLLRALSGELAPAAGTIRCLGRPLADWPAAALARRRAVLPQRPSLSFPLTIGEVVAFGRSPFAGAPAGDGDPVADALAAVGLGGRGDHPYLALSGGEQQRVHLARVLAQVADATPREPALVLADEPTDSLDLARRHDALARLRDRARAGAIGLVVVVHDPNLALGHADRVLVLDGGHAAAAGPLPDALDADVLARVYGRRPRRIEPARPGGRPRYLLEPEDEA